MGWIILMELPVGEFARLTELEGKRELTDEVLGLAIAGIKIARPTTRL